MEYVYGTLRQEMGIDGDRQATHEPMSVHAHVQAYASACCLPIFTNPLPLT